MKYKYKSHSLDWLAVDVVVTSPKTGDVDGAAVLVLCEFIMVVVPSTATVVVAVLGVVVVLVSSLRSSMTGTVMTVAKTAIPRNAATTISKSLLATISSLRNTCSEDNNNNE